MITITVKQQKKIHKLMVKIREKSHKYCSVAFENDYYEIEPDQNFNYYQKDIGHRKSESPDQLIARLEGVINELNRD